MPLPIGFMRGIGEFARGFPTGLRAGLNILLLKERRDELKRKSQTLDSLLKSIEALEREGGRELLRRGEIPGLVGLGVPPETPETQLLRRIRERATPEQWFLLRSAIEAGDVAGLREAIESIIATPTPEEVEEEIRMRERIRAEYRIPLSIREFEIATGRRPEERGTEEYKRAYEEWLKTRFPRRAPAPVMTESEAAERFFEIRRKLLEFPARLEEIEDEAKRRAIREERMILFEELGTIYP